MPKKESPAFAIKMIVLVGDRAEKFEWAVDDANWTTSGKYDPAIGNKLGTQGINMVMQRIQNAIIKRGYITTRILAGPQDLSAGTLKLIVIPGVINKVRFGDPKQAYYSAKWNAIPWCQDRLLNLRDIEQGL